MKNLSSVRQRLRYTWPDATLCSAWQVRCPERRVWCHSAWIVARTWHKPPQRKESHLSSNLDCDLARFADISSDWKWGRNS